jgi:acetyltransferase EpsM
LHPDAHLSGEVRVGIGAEIGAGATIIPGVEIGAWAVLGAGCVAVRNLSGEQTWVGVPARRIGSQSRSDERAPLDAGGMR